MKFSNGSNSRDTCVFTVDFRLIFKTNFKINISF
jgi:hypothetical protein